MTPEEWENHIEAYFLYQQLIDFLVGKDAEIAILALQKCIINLRLAKVKYDNDTPEDKEITPAPQDADRLH